MNSLEEAIKTLGEQKKKRDEEVVRLRKLLRSVLSGIENEHLYDEVLKEVQNESIVSTN